ncbi:MAG: hypothetical protein C4576_18255 [Desulfobacteraceae bacterium]|nr:MAG: hypothetical protein C4576_18255 [Desulfobacteraceae bacterium]
MRRAGKEMDLKAQVLKRYQELQKQRDEIDGELKGLQIYLKSVGAVKAPGKSIKGSGKKGSATETIVNVIGKHGDGVSIDQIMKETGLRRPTVNGVLNRMKKEKKIKAIKRGIYVKS